MTLFIEKPSFTSLQVDIQSSTLDAFVDWQADFNSKITNAQGFISLEFLSERQNSWVIVQRFVNQETSANWRLSPTYLELINKLKTFAIIKEENLEASLEKGGVTEVIVTQVNPGKENEYRLWSSQIHQIEGKFQGFRGVYIQSPEGNNKNWITLLQFDTMANLDLWLQSEERRQILQNSLPLVSSLESHRVISPYAGWFASIAKTGKIPAVWKQTMLVLLVLFPIVMFELKFLSPLISSLNSSVATFIGNAISVSLIAFPFMPIAIWFLGWWLLTDSFKVTIKGACLVGLLYLAEIILLWNFLK